MFYILLLISAVTAYLVCGINPAILLSKWIYRRDIRNEGSGNPGFTNFKRTFGWKYAWLVMLADLCKAALPVLAFRLWFGAACDCAQFGAAYTGFWCMVGHCYPAWYGFRGGKAFLTGAATVFLIDWRAGVIAAILFLGILFATKYMSLAAVSSAVVCPVAVAYFGATAPVWMLSLLSAALLVWRHRENMKRLSHREETKFYLFGKH